MPSPVALWRRRFASNPAVVGSDVNLDGAIYSIAGIMPAAFENVTAPDAEIWAPLQYDGYPGWNATGFIH